MLSPHVPHYMTNHDEAAALRPLCKAGGPPASPLYIRLLRPLAPVRLLTPQSTPTTRLLMLAWSASLATLTTPL